MERLQIQTSNVTYPLCNVFASNIAIDQRKTRFFQKSKTRLKVGGADVVRGDHMGCACSRGGGEERDHGASVGIAAELLPRSLRHSVNFQVTGR